MSTIRHIQDCIADAQERMKTYHDRHRPDQTFDVGDQVLLSVKHLALHHRGLGSSGRQNLGLDSLDHILSNPFLVL